MCSHGMAHGDYAPHKSTIDIMTLAPPGEYD